MNKRYLIIYFLIIGSLIGCNKLVQVPEPVNTITTSETFGSDANANSAITGIYYNMSVSSKYGTGAISRFCGLSSDEFLYFGVSSGFLYQMQTNTIVPAISSPNIDGNFWTPVYFNIYQANAAIEGLQSSSVLSPNLKNTLLGEAKFIRAFCYFYLINLFSDVPLVTTTAYAHTDTLRRTSISLIYQQIINDLKDAHDLLPPDYAIANGERTRANKFAAAALLARVYLYKGSWSDAETQASSVISETSTYNLLEDLNAVFLKNSGEAIWQLQTQNASPWATQDGNQFIPISATRSPQFYLTDQLLSAFEAGDKRRANWVDSTRFSGNYYYYPYKYKVRIDTSREIKEYYMVLRLAEQYLIRAEARTQLNTNINGAIDDLNTIRNRAGIDSLPYSLTQVEVLSAITRERRIELFSEWAHRWFDLKRTGQADAVLGAIKPAWKSSQQLYPIPLTELQKDPNLVQNPDY